MLQAHDEAQVATNCHLPLSHLLVGEWRTGLRIEQLQHDEKKHKIDGLAALQSDIETDTAPPGTNCGHCGNCRIFKPWRLETPKGMASCLANSEKVRHYKALISSNNGNLRLTPRIIPRQPKLWADLPPLLHIPLGASGSFSSNVQLDSVRDGRFRNGLRHTSPAHIGCGRRSPKMCPISLRIILSVDILVPTLAIGMWCLALPSKI